MLYVAFNGVNLFEIWSLIDAINCVFVAWPMTSYFYLVEHVDVTAVLFMAHNQVRLKTNAKQFAHSPNVFKQQRID